MILIESTNVGDVFNKTRALASKYYKSGLDAWSGFNQLAAKERAKLSFFKCEGTVSILVHAHRMGHLSAVRPMVKALEKLGHGHVLPPPDQLDALWQALDAMQ